MVKKVFVQNMEVFHVAKKKDVKHLNNIKKVVSRVFVQNMVVFHIANKKDVKHLNNIKKVVSKVFVLSTVVFQSVNKKDVKSMCSLMWTDSVLDGKDIERPNAGAKENVKDKWKEWRLASALAMKG